MVNFSGLLPLAALAALVVVVLVVALVSRGIHYAVNGQRLRGQRVARVARALALAQGSTEDVPPGLAPGLVVTASGDLMTVAESGEPTEDMPALPPLLANWPAMFTPPMSSIASYGAPHIAPPMPAFPPMPPMAPMAQPPERASNTLQPPLGPAHPAGAPLDPPEQPSFIREIADQLRDLKEPHDPWVSGDAPTTPQTALGQSAPSSAASSAASADDALLMPMSLARLRFLFHDAPLMTGEAEDYAVRLAQMVERRIATDPTGPNRCRLGMPSEVVKAVAKLLDREGYGVWYAPSPNPDASDDAVVVEAWRLVKAGGDDDIESSEQPVG